MPQPDTDASTTEKSSAAMLTAQAVRLATADQQHMAVANELARQVRYQEGLARCSQVLLESAPDAQDRHEILVRALAHLRDAAEVSRAYLWENINDPQHGRAMCLLAEAWEPNLDSLRNLLDTYKITTIPWSIVPPAKRQDLESGQAVGGLTEQLYADAPELLRMTRRISVQSTQIFPIHIDGHWWGFVSYEDINPHIWDELAIVTFRTAAELFGQVLRRWQAEDTLRDSEAAYRTLALEHERLYEAARQRADELEMLRQAGAVVAATLDPQEAIGRILEQIARVVPHDSASVQLRFGDMTEIIDCRGFEHPEKIIGLRFSIPGHDLHKSVYDHGTPQRIDDTIGRPAFFTIIHYPIHSWLGLPLTVHDRVIGMLTLDSARTNHFTEDHVRLGKAFADQVAIALNHTQMYKREVRARERLTILQHAVREIIAQSTALPQLYTAIHQAVKQLMPADAFVITLFDPVHEEIEHVYLADKNTLWPTEHAPVLGSFADYMLRRREPLKINNFHDFTDFAFQVFGEPDDTNSGIAVLIHGRARVLGVLFTQSYTVDAYTDEDLAILELLAAHVATTLETAALFAEVTRLATVDSLTELPNRREFFRRAGQELIQVQRTRRPLSMVMLDVDRFKQINDTHGHQVGDQVIRTIAAVCRSNLRPTDVAGRYGGEEIAILLPETNRADAARTAERVRLAIEQLQITIGLKTIRVTASLGVATATATEEQSLEELLSCADNAMYLAKQRGRNQVTIWDAPPPH